MTVEAVGFILVEPAGEQQFSVGTSVLALLGPLSLSGELPDLQVLTFLHCYFYYKHTDCQGSHLLNIIYSMQLSIQKI